LSCVRSDAASGFPSGRCRPGADASRIGGCKRNGKQSSDFSPPSSFGLRRAAFASNLFFSVQPSPFCQSWPASRSSQRAKGSQILGNKAGTTLLLALSLALELVVHTTRNAL